MANIVYGDLVSICGVIPNILVAFAILAQVSNHILTNLTFQLTTDFVTDSELGC